MVKYLDGDFGPEHFSKDFGFTDSAYQSRADHNRRARQKNGVADNDAAVGEGDGTYVSRSHGGRLHRAMGGIAQQTITPTNRPTGDQTSPGGEMLGGATVTMPAINMARAADRMVQMGRGQGAREAMAMQGAHMPPGATQSLVANPPVHTPGIPGLKKGGRAPVPPAGQHPKGVLVIIAGHPPGALGPMKSAGRARGGRMHKADGGDASFDDAGTRPSKSVPPGYRPAEPRPDLSHLTNAPVGQNFARWWRGDSAMPAASAHGPSIDTAGMENIPTSFHPMTMSEGAMTGRDQAPESAPAPMSMSEGAMTGRNPAPAAATRAVPRPSQQAKQAPRSAAQPQRPSVSDMLTDYWNSAPNPTPDGARAYLAFQNSYARGGRLCAADGGPITYGERQDAANGYKNGGRLTAKQRHALPRGDFALPGHGEGSDHKGSGSYPIDTEARGRNALARAAQHASPSEQARIRAAVHRKYPDIGKR